MSNTKAASKPTKKRVIPFILLSFIILISFIFALLFTFKELEKSNIEASAAQLTDSFTINKSVVCEEECIAEFVISEAESLYTQRQITIVVDNQELTIETAAKTVGEVLEEQDIVLDSDDEVVPTINTTLASDMTINILRVEYATREVEESIPFSVKEEKTSAMKKGIKKVTQEGVNGLKITSYKDKIVNGVVESSELIEEKIAKEPINKIIKIGTLVVKSFSKFGNTKIEKNGNPISEIDLSSKYSIGENNVPVEYKYKITGRAAAYYQPGSKTATGKPVMPGRIAVNPKQIPYGTEMWIVSDSGIIYGYAVAEDTGGFASRGYYTVDLYMHSESQCRKWGDKGVTIYVL